MACREKKTVGVTESRGSVGGGYENWGLDRGRGRT